MFRKVAIMMVAFAGSWYGQQLSAQTYPVKPIRILTTAPGGGSDIVSRILAETVSGSLGQQVVVDNRAGIIAVEAAATAAPDGYTLLHYGSVIWVEPLLREHVPWDVARDFAPITTTTQSPNTVVVTATLPVSTLKALIALGRARPGELNYGSAGVGATTHLAAELFNVMTGSRLVRVPYKGNGPAIIDLIAGQVQVMFPTIGEVSNHLKSGRLRALAVTTARRSSLAPELPTSAEAGLPGFESASVLGLMAPSKTPPAIVQRLNQEFVRALSRPEARDRYLRAGLEPIPLPPDEFASVIKAETLKWGKVIKAAGIRVE